MSIDAANDESRPLADRLRPAELAELVGQDHLLGPEAPLGRLAREGRLHSMILWGPPGSGKTTLAKLLADRAGLGWISLSAVLSGVRDVREAVQSAQAARRLGESTVLFVDEVHRFNKAQQDAFLPHVEKGTVTFIGATTENPSFEVNAALLSRARVYVLKPLGEDALRRVAERAAGMLQVSITDAGEALLIELADGDARRLLNILETVAQLAEGAIDEKLIGQAAGARWRHFDKGGRCLLRTDLRSAQSCSGQCRGRGAVLVLPHVGRRLRPALYRETAGAHGQRGHRQRRPTSVAVNACRRGRL